MAKRRRQMQMQMQTLGIRHPASGQQVRRAKKEPRNEGEA
jgi:hypothetical protein